jgi:hypothetical protein
MEWYLLSRLLVFLKRQQAIGYQGVNICMSIMESNDMTYKQKQEAILDFLKQLELFDDEPTKKISKELEDKLRLNAMTSGSLWDSLGIGPIYPTQLFDCEFLNGKIWFERGLN